MSKSRASIFDESAELDLASFTPKTTADPTAPPPEQVRQVSHNARFRSREATPEPPAAPVKRAARRYRTGRNVQFNAKVSQETYEAIYAVTDANAGWVLGYTVQRAIEALQRELKKQP